MKKINQVAALVPCCTVMHTPEALSSPPATLKTDVVEKGLSGKMILAPLTRGGNLPFRRLCSDFGMEAGLSELIYAGTLLKGASFCLL